jgi:predicted SnoaL-like aldol condensation-catalyzing enzyme
MQTDLEHNKNIVMTFYDLAFNQKQPAEAMRLYGGPTYTQHNPHVKDGPQGFVEFVTDFVMHFPQLRIDIQRVIAEGDLVVLHAHARTSPQDRGMAAVDIFRVDNGRVVEHWDVLQPLPYQSANGNGMF